MPKALSKTRRDRAKAYQLPKRLRCRDKYERAFQNSLQRVVEGTRTDEDINDAPVHDVPGESRWLKDANLNWHPFSFLQMAYKMHSKVSTGQSIVYSFPPAAHLPLDWSVRVQRGQEHASAESHENHPAPLQLQRNLTRKMQLHNKADQRRRRVQIMMM